MPQLLPFAGLRPGVPVVGSVDVVICPPYDIITEEQRVALLARSPYNVVRVELPNGHYAEAARLLQGWQAEPGARPRRQAGPVRLSHELRGAQW